MLILRGQGAETSYPGVNDSGQQSSKPCQVPTSQAGNMQAGAGVWEAAVPYTYMAMAMIYFGIDSTSFLLNTLCLSTESSEVSSFVPKDFLLYHWQPPVLLSFSLLH